ncbi:hypothetical protein D9M09_00795 [Janthinobacterium agaricidamnosum]|uniref:Uncharacterized protein n=1 Tax=Janthinobacterium agaricidamnosum TaxID=55508 RepID=A0A3G2E2K2_9BURK|nr:hypothetical protein D9M09_00795 [Janthinobacterium agaricidamnosum]
MFTQRTDKVLVLRKLPVRMEAFANAIGLAAMVQSLTAVALTAKPKLPLLAVQPNRLTRPYVV